MTRKKMTQAQKDKLSRAIKKAWRVRRKEGRATRTKKPSENALIETTVKVYKCPHCGGWIDL